MVGLLYYVPVPLATDLSNYAHSGLGRHAILRTNSFYSCSHPKSLSHKGRGTSKPGISPLSRCLEEGPGVRAITQIKSVVPSTLLAQRARHYTIRSRGVAFSRRRQPR